MDFWKFCKLVSSESDLVTYFQERGVLCQAVTCETCRREMRKQAYSEDIDGYCFRCPTCKRRRSIRHNSFLQKSKLELKTFAAILFFHHAETLQKHVAELVGISEQTLVDYSNFIREQCGSLLENETEMLGGPGVRVQVIYLMQFDESVLSAPKLTRNQHARPVPEKWVVGAYDTVRKVGWIKRVVDRSEATLSALISRWCLPGTIIVTDGWRGYSGVTRLGFQHEVVVHEHHFVDPVTGVNTNAVESFGIGARSVLNGCTGRATNCWIRI